jgi:hypothetical protein
LLVLGSLSIPLSPVFGEVRVYTYSLLVNVFIIHPSLPFSVGSVFLLFLAYRVFFLSSPISCMPIVPVSLNCHFWLHLRFHDV